MINLDCETDERLQRVHDALIRALRRLRDREDSYRITERFGAPCGAPAIKRSVCSYLVQYVDHLQKARRARLSGYLGVAQRHEEVCDRIYNYYLPQKLRW